MITRILGSGFGAWNLGFKRGAAVGTGPIGPCAHIPRPLNLDVAKNIKGGYRLMKKGWGMVSFILFCIGLVLAVVGAFLAGPMNVVILMLLVLFGLIIGIIHVVYAKEATTLHTLLLATIALLAMAAAFAPIALLGIGKMLESILVNFAAMMAPVALIAAIAALLKIGLEK
jgi:hypothetical protein